MRRHLLLWLFLLAIAFAIAQAVGWDEVNSRLSPFVRRSILPALPNTVKAIEIASPLLVVAALVVLSSPTVRRSIRRMRTRIRATWVLTGLALLVLPLVIACAFVIPQRLVPDTVEPNDRPGLENDIRTTLLQGVVGLLVVSGGLIAWRQLLVSREGQISERWTRAVDQLGKPEIEIQLGGIHALERIIKDSLDYRPQAVELLATYIRLRSQSRPGSLKSGPPSADVKAAISVLARREILSNKAEVIALSQADLHLLILPRADLRHTDFQMANLERAWLWAANLEGVIFNDARLEGITLRYATLISAHFERANLRNAKLRGAKLRGANLRNADLQGAELLGADLRGADLQGAKLLGSDLRGAKLTRAQLDNANLEGARLEGARLSSANLQRARLYGARPGRETRRTRRTSLFGANLNGADLRGTNLQEVLLVGVDFSGANLEGASLQNTWLWWTNLTKANLIRADLEKTRLVGGRLYGADLTNANLRGSTLLGSRFTEKVRYQSTYTDRHGRKRLRQVSSRTTTSLRDVDLQEATLLGITLGGADLVAVNLQGSILAFSSLKESTLAGGTFPITVILSSFRGATLEGALLHDRKVRFSTFANANLREAVLTGITLLHVNLSEADLRSADLKMAKLQRVNLQGVRLQNADLRGAKFERSKLSGASFTGAKLNGDTTWPDDFDPVAAGAVIEKV